MHNPWPKKDCRIRLGPEVDANLRFENVAQQKKVFTLNLDEKHVNSSFENKNPQKGCWFITVNLLPPFQIQFLLYLAPV